MTVTFYFSFLYHNGRVSTYHQQDPRKGNRRGTKCICRGTRGVPTTIDSGVTARPISHSRNYRMRGPPSELHQYL